MKERYRLFLRRGSVYYAFDNTTGKKQSLDTKNRGEAQRLVMSFLFPNIAKMHEKDRAKAFIRRLRLVNVSGVFRQPDQLVVSGQPRERGYRSSGKLDGRLTKLTAQTEADSSGMVRRSFHCVRSMRARLASAWSIAAHKSWTAFGLASPLRRLRIWPCSSNTRTLALSGT